MVIQSKFLNRDLEDVDSELPKPWLWPGKLGSPKPDQCRSGVRGVFFDKEAGG